jgi:uncharacterized protein YigA (DUF484 family)
MSTLEQPQADVADIDETQIAAYLQSNPEFFERHPAVLAKLRLPHSPGGTTVSLVERQVAVLRQNNIKLERKLRDLLDVARGNDQLAGKIHRLRLSFKADRAMLVLFHTTEGLGNSRFLRVVSREADELAPFRTFLEAGNARCGRIRDAQRRFLFGDDDVEIGSAALLPLGKKAATGFLAVGSRDVDHFHPGKSIDFLSRLGELVTCALDG